MCVSITDVGPPRNFEGEVRSANSIQLTWTEPQSESGGDRIESYELYYNDTHFRQNVRVSVSPAYTSYLLSDLTSSTVYHLRLAARTSRGEGPSTDTIQLQTLDYGYTCLLSLAHMSSSCFGSVDTGMSTLGYQMVNNLTGFV